MAGEKLKIVILGFAILNQISPSLSQLLQYAPSSFSTQLSNSLLSNLLSSNPSIIPQKSSFFSSSFPSIPLSVGVSSMSPLPNSAPPCAPTLPSYYSSLPNPAISIPTLATECNQVIPPSTTPVDTNVLNNLAIALQLLIVSNLLNVPQDRCDNDDVAQVSYMPQQNYVPAAPPTYLPPAPTPTYVQPTGITPTPYVAQPYAAPIQAKFAGQPPQYAQAQPVQTPCEPTYSYPPNAFKNSNYLGSSSYVDSGSVITSFGVPPLKPRQSLALMSPYEAISPSSPYSDPILSSPYGSIITSKNDFQSPYSLF